MPTLPSPDLSIILRDPVDRYILESIATRQKSVAVRAAEKFGLTRQATSARIRRLVSSGLVDASGKGPARTYALRILSENLLRFQLGPGLQEDVVYKDHVKPLISDLPQPALSLWSYCVTEMVNNAVDHSGGEFLNIFVRRDAVNTVILVRDDGEGIFHRIQRILGLNYPQEAILELSKGKLTTDPERHTGEGIFFTSRMVDAFYIVSRTLFFTHHHAAERDVLMDWDQDSSGSSVHMQLSNATTREFGETFERYSSSPEDGRFDKTVVPVSLAQHEGERLVSRSQAKRLVARFERFRDVILNFEGVAEIGQAFADEVFRVFARAHPNVKLTHANASAEVAMMIRRALAAADDDAKSLDPR